MAFLHLSILPRGSYAAIAESSSYRVENNFCDQLWEGNFPGERTAHCRTPAQRRAGKELKLLSEVSHKKGQEFKNIQKIGRTDDQDAVPMTPGQEFHAFGYQLDAEMECLVKTEGYLLFRKNCIDGITANEDVLKHYIDRSVGIVTALNPVLGYEKTTELAREALQLNKGILELIREKKLLTEEQIKKLLDPAAMTGQQK